MMNFKQVEFVKTAVKPEHYPKQRLPEIAVVGRSNVGKSSLLNHLFCRKNLVKTSATPGKTQAIQFFLVDERLMVVDLPGYGYARAPKSEQMKWAKIIESYFEEREQLHFVLFLLDVRRTPNQNDLQFLEWAAHNELPVLLIFTKADKVKKGQRKQQIDRILADLPEKLPHVVYSTLKNMGRPELIQRIQEGLDGTTE